MNILQKLISDASVIAIAGHIRPDGDCIGACMGLYEYITCNYPDKTVVVLIDEVPECFHYLAKKEAYQKKSKRYDLLIALDCGDEERLGDIAQIMKEAKHSLNIDHHLQNTKYADDNYIIEGASSTCEVLFQLMDEDKIDKNTAAALYTGIIHDTGVFRHCNTSKKTMDIAGKLIDKGIPFTRIIDESFFMKSFVQLQIMGRCLLESVRIMDKRCIFTVVTMRVMKFYGIRNTDLDGIVEQLRTTEGIEVAILLTEREPGKFGVSMRSNHQVDVSKICRYFGGGGHKKAAGCEIYGSPYDVINNLTEHIEVQLEG
ncbi:MAG: DHH family phosphoesterase [Lachnoclostridium sp.]|jgi:phosphoesterase RecJ-like protein|nr:DHH family phosphoesterase [Lachnoclostridium sp.]